MNIPKFGTYGNYSSSNYGAHCLYFDDPSNNTFYFSYRTLVAFRGKNGIVCLKNYWGPTTGKHLNWLEPDHSKRVDKETFNRLLGEL